MFVRTCFQSPPDPLADVRILNMHELRSDRVGINSVEPRDHVAQRHRPIVEEELRRNAKIEVGVGEPKLAQTQQWISRPRLCQRIYARDRVTQRAISVNQSIDSRLQCCFASLDLGFGRPVTLRKIPQFESFKKGGPPGIDGVRILLPKAILFLDQMKICASVN